MQGKGLIKFFAVAFAIVCLYQLSFTFFTRRVESKAKNYANRESMVQKAEELSQGDALKKMVLLDSIHKAEERYYLDSMSSEVVFNLLVRKYTYRECKERELNLGLDLKGGMNVTLEVSVVDIIKALSGNSIDPTFVAAIDKANQMAKTSREDYVTLFGNAFEQIDPNARLAAIFSTPEMRERIPFQASNNEVLEVLRKETNDAIDRSYQILRTRIDRFGVAQPNIQKLATSGRILIELPGIKEPERVRKLLQGTARLEFWETYEFGEIANFFYEANERLRLMNEGNDSIGLTEALPVDSNAVIENEVAETAPVDTAKVTEAEDLLAAADTTGKSLMDIVDADSSATAEMDEAEMRRQNPLLAYLQLAVYSDGQGGIVPGRGPVVGMAAIKDTARVSRMLRNPQVVSIFPRNLKLLWTNKPDSKTPNILQLIAIKASARDGSCALDGDVIVDARYDYNHQNQLEISMTMNNQGAKEWKRITAANIDRSIAIVLDDYVLSFPTVNTEIPNGRSVITGNNTTLAEAQDLANILKAGSLPAPARIVEEAVVGPSLGREAIQSGLISFLIAFLVVLLYMFLYYNKAGLVADIALLSNMFLMFGVLASLGATLTMPGIAGIVLTLGMAVDANVIIFERTLEEIRAGKGLRLAIADGYKNAYSAIIDGNVTTILTGIILYIFGSGPVQGFATTLIIGIICSLFTAIFISRLIFTYWLDHNRNITFDNKVTRNVLTKVNFDFIGKRKKMYLVSGIAVVIVVASFFVRGMSYGVDFSGGRSYVVRFDQSVNSVDVRSELAKQFGEAPEVKTFGSANQVKVTSKYMITDDTPQADSIVEARLFDGVKGFYKETITFEDFTADDEAKVLGRLSSQKIGPTIAQDIKVGAVLAVLFSLLVIFIYIAIRFNKWQYGVGGLVSLAFVTIMVIGAYSLFHNVLPFSMEVDQVFIAAVLTIIGYAINDTVIVFDRIRENMHLFPKRDNKTNMNTAVNATLSRTLNTSGTTLAVLLVIFLFGGEVIRGFAFALLLGVAIGTYSSIFTATPIAYDLMNRKKKQEENK